MSAVTSLKTHQHSFLIDYFFNIKNLLPSYVGKCGIFYSQMGVTVSMFSTTRNNFLNLFLCCGNALDISLCIFDHCSGLAFTTADSSAIGSPVAAANNYDQ